MAEKKTKKKIAKKKITPATKKRIKKVARLIRSNRWRTRERQQDERELWRLTCIASSERADTKKAIKQADDVLAAYRERFSGHY